MKMLITGSRDATPAMLEKARWLVRRAKAKGDEIVVGDADGVDLAVMIECHKLGVKHQVWGAYGRMRHWTETGASNCIEGDYPARDRKMAQLCDECTGVWNGISRGTRLTMEAAKRLGKPTWVVRM